MGFIQIILIIIIDFYFNFTYYKIWKILLKIWGLGIGDWGLGIGDWGLGPIPNPQSPIPNPHRYKTLNFFYK